jgi:uncharacterized protein (TIGR00255 family)
MESMTGYGSAERRWQQAAGPSGIVAVECVSLNRKQLEVVVQLPRAWNCLEPYIREEVQKYFERGRIAVGITWSPDGKAELPKATLSRDAARVALHDLQNLQKELGLGGPITLELLLQHPAFQQGESLEIPPDQIRPVLAEALQAAIVGLRKMRQAEGAQLRRELEKQVRGLVRAVQKIRRRAPKVAANYGAALRARLVGWKLPTEISPDRLAMEIALCAERCDIAEELSRLDGHLETFQNKLALVGTLGRTLEFLVQEMFREINTIGAKANDGPIAQLVVEGKSRLDKLREQLANLA